LPGTLFLADKWMLTHTLTRQASSLWPEINNKHTRDTHFQGITDNIYDFGRLFCPFLFYPSTTDISTCPQRVLPIQMAGGRGFA